MLPATFKSAGSMLSLMKQPHFLSSRSNSLKFASVSSNPYVQYVHDPRFPFGQRTVDRVMLEFGVSHCRQIE